MTDIQLFLLIACRDNLRYVVPPGGLVTKTLRNHDFTVSQVFSSIHVDTISLNHVNTVPPFASARPPHSYIPIAPFSRPHAFSLLQIRRLQYVLECNHKMLKVIVQVRSTPSSKKGKTRGFREYEHKTRFTDNLVYVICDGNWDFVNNKGATIGPTIKGQ